MRWIHIPVLLILLAVVSLSLSAHEDDEHLSIHLEKLVDGLMNPVDFDAAPDGSGRLFVVEQAGRIRVLDANGQMMSDVFLDLTDNLVELMPEYDERGLLGLAFHPDFASNGRFFVYYSAPLQEGAPADWNHTSHLSEFIVSSDNPNVADRSSERILMQIDQPQFNHNAGDITFGPDGYLYVPLGDGGNADDRGTGHTPDIGNAQDTTNIYGSILRLDVNSGDPYGIPQDNVGMSNDAMPDEIWAWGFRNPWNVAFDAGGNQQLFVADAGQENWEEVSIVGAGQNYGWSIYEGVHCFSADYPKYNPLDCAMQGQNGEALVKPIIEFSHLVGNVVIGGYVYRGSALDAEFEGHYFFGAYGSPYTEMSGDIFLAEAPPAEMGTSAMWKMLPLEITRSDSQERGLNAFLLGFGADSNHEIYALTTAEQGPLDSTGAVWRIVSESETEDSSAPPPESTEEASGDAQVIEVELASFEIHMPTTLEAGTYTFVVTNAADTEHNFEIEGQGMESVLPNNLQMGETGEVTVDLQPGTYEVYCPVGDHAEQGMRLTLEVTEAE